MACCFVVGTRRAIHSLLLLGQLCDANVMLMGERRRKGLMHKSDTLAIANAVQCTHLPRLNS